MSNLRSGSDRSDLLLEVHDLEKTFPVKASAFSIRKLELRAVDGVSFDIRRGETLGLVGESGCGKTTVGRTLLRLYEPTGGRAFLDPAADVVEGVLAKDSRMRELEAEMRQAVQDRRRAREITALRNEARDLKIEADSLAATSDIFSMDPKTLKESRRRLQIVFQDPWASLNPRMIVKEIIAEGLREFKVFRKGRSGGAAERLAEYQGKDLDGWVAELMDRVGLPRQAASKYPHEFSGGQRQRIGIARALSLTPSLIICDEPVSALDVSIQAQILNLLLELQDEFDLTYVFIAHDLSVVQYISDRIAVMYLGRIVEIASNTELNHRPRHPYTVSLLSSVPVADPEAKREEIILEGDVPSPINPPPGCTFHPRCSRRMEICSQVRPELREDAPEHQVACHNPYPR